MTELQQLRLDLLNEMVIRLTPYGFTKKRDQSLYRKTEQGRDYFQLIFSANPGVSFRIDVAVAIRNDRLEQLIDQVGTMPLKDRKGTASIGLMVMNLMRAKWKPFGIASRDDLMPAAQYLESVYFEEYAVPYYQQFSTLESIYEVSSRDDEFGGLHNPIDANRAIEAVCAAFLLDKHEEYPELVKRKTDYLLRRHKRNMEEFLVVIDKLAVMWEQKADQK